MLQFFAEQSLHVSLPAETLFHIGPVAITNAVLVLVVGYAIVIGLFVAAARGIRHGKRSRFVTGVQWLFEMLYGQIEEVAPTKEIARRMAPMAITMFFLILVGYWLGLLPWVGAVDFGEAPLFRGGITDLNFTFALAVITMISVQIYGVRVHGFFGNLKRYFVNPFKNPTGAFAGVLELIAEFSRGTALSLRLFGNVFAGEILIAVIAFLSSYLTPVTQPIFIAFELFIGIIQAYVFFMLTVVYISVGLVHEDTAAHEEDHNTQAPADKAGVSEV